MLLPPLSLYIHIPWCVRKCPYCDFNSHQIVGNLPETLYVSLLKQDIDNDLTQVQGRKLQSIFIGGGTPSLFSAGNIETVLDYAEKKIGFTGDIEITLEANPGTIDQEKFKGFYSAGVNRISIGVQSFQQHHLQNLGRIHTANEAERAVVAAKEAGFSNINIDLMHGLPTQTLTEAEEDIRTAIALEPEHISWYQLTIEPNTLFYRQPPTLPTEKLLTNIQILGQDLLRDANYLQYEISAFSQRNWQSKHNRNYWQFGDYLGIGAGAHGKSTDTTTKTVWRRQKTRQPKDYLKPKSVISFVSKHTAVATDQLPLEFMMNGLRLIDGVPLASFTELTGLDFDLIKQSVDKLINLDLLIDSTTRLVATPRGRLFLDSVLAEFMN